jgi:hypothetical protein
MPGEIEWQGLRVNAHPSGLLGVCSAATGRPLIRYLGLRLTDNTVADQSDGPHRADPAVWQVSDVQWEEDGVTQVWSCPHNGDRVVVQHLFGESWTVRVVPHVGPGRAPLARWTFDTPWPVLGWAGGNLACAVFQWAPQPAAVEPTGEAVLMSRLVRGWYDGSGFPMVGVQAWQLDWVPDLHQVAHRMPHWLPPRLDLDSGEELVLQLPDAAVMGVDVAVGTQTGQTTLSAASGVHRVEIRSAGGTVVLQPSWSIGAEHWLAVRAVELSGADPLQLTTTQGFLLELALTSGVLPATQDNLGILEDVAESVDDKSADVFDVPFLILHGLRTGDSRWLLQAANRLAGVNGVGAFHAWEQLMLSARYFGSDLLHGIRPPEIWRHVSQDETDEHNLEAAIADLERRLRPSEAGFIRFMSRLLGGGMPLDGLPDLRVAQLCELLERVVEWPELAVQHAQLGQWIADRRRRLLASQPADDVLAWLLW